VKGIQSGEGFKTCVDTYAPEGEGWMRGEIRKALILFSSPQPSPAGEGAI